MKWLTAIPAFGVSNLRSGTNRPVEKVNAWVAALDDPDPKLTIEWKETQSIRTIELDFDADFDHPMESVLMSHPESVMPFCIREFIICDDRKQRIYAATGNYQGRVTVKFDEPVQTQALHIHLKKSLPNVPAALFDVRCYG